MNKTVELPLESLKIVERNMLEGQNPQDAVREFVCGNIRFLHWVYTNIGFNTMPAVIFPRGHELSGRALGGFIKWLVNNGPSAKYAKTLLDAFDWSYMMSDDYSVTRRWRDLEAALRAALQKMSKKEAEDTVEFVNTLEGRKFTSTECQFTGWAKKIIAQRAEA